MSPHRAFTPPWNVDEATESFCIRGAKGQTLALYFDDETGRRMAMGRGGSPRTSPGFPIWSSTAILIEVSREALRNDYFRSKQKAV
jgi:hypothetical protein